MPVRRGRSPSTSARTVNESVVGDSIAPRAIRTSSVSTEAMGEPYATAGARPTTAPHDRIGPRVLSVHGHSRRCSYRRAPPDGVRAGRSRQGRAGRGAALGARDLRAAPAPSRPDQAARAPGEDARARAGADSLWAHAGVAVHLLSGCGADHGQRPGRDAALG